MNRSSHACTSTMTHAQRRRIGMELLSGYILSLWNRLMQFLYIIAIFLSLASPTLADQLSDTQAVEAGAKVLDSSADFPWYDAKSDGVQRLDVSPPKDLKNRDSKWEFTINPKTNRWSMPDWVWVMLEVLGWTLLTIALIAVGYFLVQTFLSAEAGFANGEAAAEQTIGIGDAQRVENLPFQLEESKTDLIGTARLFYEAGNYRDAIIYLYSYQLVELDKHQMIRLTKGKTNRQYLREVRRRRELFGALQTTMLAFEDAFFGNHTIDRVRFEACWTGLDLFQQSLEQATA
jgi:Domain of unknown function (DUF4129)